MAAEIDNRVLRYIRENDMLPRGSRVLAAFSGGCDSTAMLLLLLRLSSALGVTVCAAHVNHMLRGADADADAAFCEAFCRERGVDFVLKKGDAAALARELGTGTEDGARQLRYSLLEEAARELRCGLTATAHTADDNLETVLLHLARGGGSRAVAGIPPKRGEFIRPILCLSRADTEAVCAAEKQKYVTDATNFSDDYARNYVRHNIVPCFKKLNPGAADIFLRNAALARADGDYLDALAGEKEISELAALPLPLASRVVRRVCPASVDAVKTEAVLKLAKNGSRGSVISLGNGVYCEKTADGIAFTGKRAAPEGYSYELAAPFHAQLPGGRTAELEKCVNGQKIYNLLTSFAVNCDTINDKLELRTPRSGDIFRKNGKSGSKPLRRLLTDMKLSPKERAELPVVADGRGVLWVCGIGRNAEFAPYDAAREGVMIKITEKKEGEQGR